MASTLWNFMSPPLYYIIHRLINLTFSEQNFNKELQVVKQLVISNGYEES